MADANYVRFNNRLRQIDRTHHKLSRGYVRLVERDGMLVPVAQKRIRLGFPWRGLMLTIAVFLVFKAGMLAHLGAAAYDFRVGKLADGNMAEQFGGWIMQADPITRWIASQITYIF